jgi:hypothetical protein
MLQTATVDFQGFPATLGESTRHGRDMGGKLMLSWTAIEWKKCHDLEPGELACAHLGGGRTLLLKLANIQGGSEIGILAGTDRALAFQWFALNADAECLTFGRDWLLDADMDAQFFPENPDRFDLSSPLSFDQGGYVLTFQPGPGQGMMAEARSFRLARNEVGARRSNEFAPIMVWSIWGSEKHRADPRSQPIFRYPERANADQSLSAQA